MMNVDTTQAANPMTSAKPTHNTNTTSAIRSTADLLKTFSRYEMPLQFCLVDEKITSIVSFYNYYDQIFPELDIPVDLYIAFFDGDGREVALVKKEIASHGSIQFDAREVVKNFCGMVGVMGVPRTNLDQIAENRLVLRKSISTGYYMTWLDGQGHNDVMHEWESLRQTPSAKRRHFVTLDNYSGYLDWGVVLMNHTLSGTGSTSPVEARPVLTVKNLAGKVLGSKELPALKCMQTRHVKIKDVFPELNKWLEEEKGVLGLCVESENMVMPISTEWHRSGDFHFHHF